MEPKKIETIIIETINECLEASGEKPPQFDSRTRPFSDIKGFDSHMAVDVCIALEEKIDFNIKPGEEIYLFAEKKSRRLLMISETIECILEMANGNGGDRE